MSFNFSPEPRQADTDDLTKQLEETFESPPLPPLPPPPPLADDEDELYLDDETVKLLSKEFSYISRSGLRWITKASNNSSLGINKFDRPSWKSRNNHYVNYSDIKVNSKENVNLMKQNNHNNNNKTMTHEELMRNLNEWKFHYVISQVNNLIDCENESSQVVSDVESLIQTAKFQGLSDITFKINESIKANTQRHNFINEQLDETRLLIHKLIDNKEKFKNQLIIDSSSSSKLDPSSQVVVNETSSGENHCHTYRSKHKSKKRV
jgi:hypothetical protein